MRFSTLADRFSRDLIGFQFFNTGVDFVFFQPENVICLLDSACFNKALTQLTQQFANLRVSQPNFGQGILAHFGHGLSRIERLGECPAFEAFQSA